MNSESAALHWWDIKPEVFWTDWLIYLLIVAVVAFMLYARRREHLRAPWRSVLRRRLAMASMVVLFAYVVLGLLDSVHFRERLPVRGGEEVARYSPEVLSLLDKVLTPLRKQVEKTYSAPFAAYQYTKETVDVGEGQQTRTYLRLRYGGAHLQQPDTERMPDIFMRLAAAVWQAALAWLVFVFVVTVWLSRRYASSVADTFRRILRGELEVPWKVILGSIGVLLLLAFAIANLGTRYHILGTDKVGQDVLYLALKSIRTGLVIGTLTTLVMLPFAIMLGIMAGYFRGWVDDVIQYIYTTLNSIPGVLLIAAAILLLDIYIASHPEQFSEVTRRADARLLFLCIILGITSWTSLCRLLRGETLKLRQVDYIQAATAFGVRDFKIIVQHILPNVMHIVLITVVLDFSGLVLAEAVLSYVGVGVDPSMNSWGNMINSARLEMAREPIVWWSLLAAFVFMFALVLAANLFSDAVRDAFDPRLRRS